MKNLIICCFLSFFNSPVNLCLPWQQPFHHCLWPSKLHNWNREGSQVWGAWPQSLCHLLPGSATSLHKPELWDGFTKGTRLSKMAPGFLPCRSTLSWACPPRQQIFCFFFSGSFQRRSSIQEHKQLIPISFYPRVCKRHSLTFFVLWEHYIICCTLI